MSNTLSYILWLPSWYPNKLGPFDGDFIQRHAQAVSAFTPVHVLHLVRDKKGIITRSVSMEEKEEGDLRETIIYYYSPSFFPAFADKFFSQQKFNALYRKFLSSLFSEKGFPSLVHVHIAFKAGLIAEWIKRQTGIPYLLTEQWTVYLDDAKPAFSDLPYYQRSAVSRIVQQASLLLPVSGYLGKAIQKKWPGIKYEVVPNVVNRDIFFPAEKKDNDGLKLVHISTLSYQKDPERLFAAAGILKKKGVPFSLDIFGLADNYIQSLVNREGVDREVMLRGEVNQPVLADTLRSSDALVLYSRYETFGCVIIEANACGIPVIVPDTVLMRELVKDGINGILVKPGNAEALAAAFILLAKTKKDFDSKAIAASAEQYAFEKIGKRYYEICKRYSKP